MNPLLYYSREEINSNHILNRIRYLNQISRDLVNDLEKLPKWYTSLLNEYSNIINGTFIRDGDMMISFFIGSRLYHVHLIDKEQELYRINSYRFGCATGSGVSNFVHGSCIKKVDMIKRIMYIISLNGKEDEMLLKKMDLYRPC